MRTQHYDVVTVQDPYYIGFVGYLLARKFRIGLEVQIHGWERYAGLRKVLAKFLIPRANVVRTVSQRLKKQLVREFGVAEEQIIAVPIFTALQVTHHEIQNKNNAAFIFLTVCRLVPIKRIDLQIKAMAELIQKYPQMELWIAGDGRERKKLEAMSAAHGVQHAIKFLGWQDDLTRIYAQAHAFILSSDYEGWGLAVIEAASYGVPVIMTDVGCAGEVIIHEQSGLVIPVGDVAALVASMLRMYTDTALQQKLAQGAYQALKKLPTKKATLALYKKSWEKACAIQK